jgi:exosome complex exonuclease RRP6
VSVWVYVRVCVCACVPVGRYPHPYEREIKSLKRPASYYARVKEQLFRPLAQTPVTWIDTPTQLATLAALLEGCSEFAVDLEHHDYRSFQGFVCLVQISTRTEDFLVDALALRSHLPALAPAFANPRITKV